MRDREGRIRDKEGRNIERGAHERVRERGAYNRESGA